MATALLPQLQPQASGMASPLASTPPEQSSGLLTRNWVPPPRPKPGRKPATDTPPSKRKAQNRLAQRNFRERRAAKVNELEDQMKELQAEHDAEVEETHSSNLQLKGHIELLEATLSSSRILIQNLQAEVEKERSLRLSLEEKLFQAEKELEKAGVVPLRRRKHQKPVPETNGVGPSFCENCSLQDCKCLESFEKAFPNGLPGLDSVKRPSSPLIDTTSKRPRISRPNNLQNSLETDLTTRPRAMNRVDRSAEATTLSAGELPIDSCGFCDSNPDACLCRASREAEIAEQARNNDTAAASGCTGVPGSCQQCQEDPRSAQFCKSFARSHSPQDPDKPCGAIDCCQNKQTPSHPRSGSLSDKMQSLSTAGGNAGGSTLDCAAVYRKLQVHPRFDEAMANVDDWTPQLRHPMPRPEIMRNQSLEGRTPYEIEAASVMSTLKYFDSKFGSDAKGDWRNQR